MAYVAHTLKFTFKVSQASIILADFDRHSFQFDHCAFTKCQGDCNKPCQGNCENLQAVYILACWQVMILLHVIIIIIIWTAEFPQND
jgi:hypothetical protein